LELILPLVVITFIGLGWFVGLRSKSALEKTVTRAYQETQLEIVKTVSRSTLVYVKDQIEAGADVETIEQNIFKLFVEPVRLLENGDAWIYTPDHVVFDLSSDFPEEYRNRSMAEIFAMQAKLGASHYEDMTRDVMQAREGTGWYVWLPDKGREIASWTPVRFGSHVWTIGLSTPLSEILKASGAEEQGQFLLLLLVIGSVIGMAVTSAATWSLFHRQRLDRQLHQSHAELGALVTDLRKEVERRKLTEEQMQEANARMNALIEAIPEAIVFKDQEGRNLVVNSAYERLAGRSGECGPDGTDHVFLSDERSEAWHVGDEQVLKGGKPFRMEERVVLPTGESRSLETYKAPILDREGKVLGLVGVSRDITDQKLAERERQRLTAQLMQAQKMEAIGTLAGGVAHDLNNILAGIVSYPELIMLKMEPDDPLRKVMLTIQKSGERAAGIVQDLLTLSRRGVAATEVVDLNQMVTEYLNSPSHDRFKLDRPEIRTEVQLERKLLKMVGSPVHLSKTIMNLVINAYEAIEGAGIVRIITENCYVDNRIKGAGTSDVVEGEYVKLTVSDTGKGIVPDDLQRIFEPFYTKKVMGHSGTGLGLSVVWGTVQDHCGFIDVHSTPGVGTTFDVYFPVRRDVVAADKPVEMPSRMYRGQGETVLVVDDIEMQRDIAREMLTHLGYEVATAESGEEALELLKHRTVDLVILDMILGEGMDGLDTYRKILEIHPGQKAVITSGYSESDRVKEAQRLGAGSYIKKPYMLEEIGLAVKEQLSNPQGETT
jgi:PAS domain S-box-containing protein